MLQWLTQENINNYCKRHIKHSKNQQKPITSNSILYKNNRSQKCDWEICFSKGLWTKLLDIEKTKHNSAKREQSLIQGSFLKKKPNSLKELTQTNKLSAKFYLLKGLERVDATRWRILGSFNYAFLKTETLFIRNWVNNSVQSLGVQNRC